MDHTDSTTLSDQREAFYSAYYAYLKTPAWEAKRQEAISHARGRCQLCNSDHILQVHHRDYSRVGNEDIQDLTVLCASCHKTFSYKFTPARQSRAAAEHGSEFVERSQKSKSSMQSRDAKLKNKRRKSRADVSDYVMVLPCPARVDEPF